MFSGATLLLALWYGFAVAALGGEAATEMVHAPGVEACAEGGLSTERERIRHGDTGERQRVTIVATGACECSLPGVETAEVHGKVIGGGG